MRRARPAFPGSCRGALSGAICFFPFLSSTLVSLCPRYKPPRTSCTHLNNRFCCPFGNISPFRSVCRSFADQFSGHLFSSPHLQKSREGVVADTLWILGTQATSRSRIGSRLRRSPNTAPAKPQPEHPERDERACGIEQRIVRRSRAAGHEGLMDFIGNRVSRGNEKGSDSPGPTPACLATSHGAVEQNAKHKIFREVRALANDVMHEVILGLGQSWYQPAQNRLEKPSRVLGRKGVR